MLLFGMPGATEWIALIVLPIVLVIVIIKIVGKKSSKVQTQTQQQQTNLNIQNYSVTAELEKLHELKEKGIISQEEFEQQKKKFLSH
ncbi:MAG: SHOCT domain-containing protein [Bacteroidota bacterium]|jgi:uncharacterized membrane protein